MKVFPTDKTREIDAYTIEHEPISSIDLMERAARACSSWILNYAPVSRPVCIFCGPGNNGGDGLAIARQLFEAGYAVAVNTLKTEGNTSADFSFNLQRLRKIKEVKIYEIREVNQLPVLEKESLVIDALFGSGLNRPLEGNAAELVQFLNNSNVEIISIDIPSGLFGENNLGNKPGNIIKASHTLTFQFPKQAFFYSENYSFTGEWHILPIGLHEGILKSLETSNYYIDKSLAAQLVRNREKFSHKGNFGHALLIAGSYGMMGASVLASRACLKTGVGLFTSHVPVTGYQILQTSLPEAIVSIDNSEKYFSELPDISKYSAIAAGPGLSTNSIIHQGILKLIQNSTVPLVLDADALNIISMNQSWIERIPAGSIITPHPGEFTRLFGPSTGSYERNKLQIEMSVKHSLIIVLKGAYTSISCPDGSCWFNSTGNPGMAKGGSGDVFTGIILSLLAQGYKAEKAAILGVFIHGLAGDLAARVEGEESLMASDIIKHIGKAFQMLKNSTKK